MISTNATTPAARTFFRIVLTDPPTLRDFLSYEELGSASVVTIQKLRGCGKGSR